ncbi:MAG TPA: EamA/RhaT family transporter, partial [Opitutales bacterium]|nr:EamA/RhaT family transporter [Opitutales bacterium]
FMLGLSYGGRRPSHWVAGALCTVAACACFALEDVFSQAWAPGFGPYNFLIVVVGGYGIESLALMGFVRGTWGGLSRKAWAWLGVGTALMALQNVVYVLPIVLGGQATVVNILYSSRGLWSIVFVWFIGHWFNNRERQTVGAWHMFERLLGAVLMLGAISCVLF